MAERIRLAIGSAIIQHTSGTLTLTASVAVLMLTPDTPSLDQVLARMTELLKRGKNEGKNTVVFERSNFDDTDKRLRARADMCAHLAKGRHLMTVRQAIIRLEDETPCAWEFLSRYSNDLFEVPEMFFRVCAERNMLTLVDHFCIRNAVAAAMSASPETRFHINVFPSTLFAIPAEALLQTFPVPLPRDTFCFEISEQQIIGDPSYLLPAVTELRRAGMLFALDDVGYGGSCLESLVILEPEIIKIDKRCVIGLALSEPLRRQLKRYVEMAEMFGAELVAEGVENASDLAVLRDLGVRFAQGYHWGVPA
jgi:EAL domain-containing protein (putative c-di-GMP-specific phosphodiesterase class I)